MVSEPCLFPDGRMYVGFSFFLSSGPRGGRGRSSAPVARWGVGKKSRSVCKLRRPPYLSPDPDTVLSSDLGVSKSRRRRSGLRGSVTGVCGPRVYDRLSSVTLRYGRRTPSSGPFPSWVRNTGSWDASEGSCHLTLGGLRSAPVTVRSDRPIHP